MNQFKISSHLFGRNITAQVLVLSQGIHISLFGGDLPHIGAVSIAESEGGVYTKQFSGHKEGVISSEWAKKLVEAGYSPVVVEAGIHYDQLSQEGIAQVLQLSENMRMRVMEKLA